MHRRLRRYSPASVLSVACVVFSFFCLIARVAMAASNDAAAQKLRDEAIYTDYLATNFLEAEKKLAQAGDLCKQPADCTSGVRARLLCDRGVVAFTLQKPVEGRAFFVSALKEDPNVALDKDLSTTEIQREFAAIKSHPENGSGAPAAPTDGSVPSGGSAAPAPETGQPALTHEPPTSVATQTPLPVFVALPAGTAATKVLLRYKVVGTAKWQSVPMAKMGEGYGAEVPCADVGSREGTLQYFVQALDANGDLVAASARLASPWSVAIVKHLKGDAPHFPDRPAPSSCADAGVASPSVVPESAPDSDCPPGLAGCHSGEQVACVTSDDCVSGQACVSGLCHASEAAEERPTAPPKPNWLTVAFEQDLMLLPSVSNACLGGSHYTCFSDSGTYYANAPLKDADDAVNGGFALATSRLLVGYDRLVGHNVAVGGRLGLALGGGPERPTGAAFFPAHIEARAAYWFGKNVFARKGFRFFALAAGGVAEIDSSAQVDVFEPDPANPTQSRNLNLKAWKKSGLGFGALGAGSMFAFGPNDGIVLELKAIETFPTGGTAFAIQLGYSHGL